MKISILNIEPQVLSGHRIWTSVSKQETVKLWKPFKMAISAHQDLSPKKFYSISRYGKEIAKESFSVDTSFEKCAAISESLSNCPSSFEKIILDGGLYAVFPLHGKATNFQNVMQDFMINWLAKSAYRLDVRAHFETFDDSYDPFSEDSVELIHIPIIQKEVVM